MKRAIHGMIGIVLMLFILGQAMALLHMALRPDAWSTFFELAFTGRLWSALAGAVLIVLLGVYFMTAFGGEADSEDYLTFKQDGNPISIRARAVTDYISRLSDEFAAIHTVEPSIRSRAGGVVIELALEVRAGTQIPELCQLLEQRVREGVREHLGLGEIRQIRIRIKDITGDPPEPDILKDPLEVQGE